MTHFEEPMLDIIQFIAEDAITVSGVRGAGGSSGFDEAEPNAQIPTLVPPCVRT